jgi:hypothetical protein
LLKESTMKDIFSLTTSGVKVLCLVVFFGVAQACGLSAFAAMSAAFMARFGVTPGEPRAAEAKIVPTSDARARTSP